MTKTKISNHPGPGLLLPAVFSLGEADISILLATNPSLLAQSYAFPPKWGFSVIIPIHKDGIRRDPRNYHRIKLTPLDFWIPERLVDDLFVYFLKYEHNNTERQGFPWKKSCDTWRNDCLRLLTKSLNDERVILAIF